MMAQRYFHPNLLRGYAAPVTGQFFHRLVYASFVHPRSIEEYLASTYPRGV